MCARPQVILATIERHKQNSETFNKAFNSSFSREDDHIPDSSVSLLLSPWAALSSQLVACCSVTHGRPAAHHMSCACSCSTVPEQLSIYGRSRVVGANRINKFFFSSLTLADVASGGGLSLQSSLSGPNREGWSLSVYKTLMDLLWPTLGWMSGVEHRKTHQKVLTDTWR